MNNNTGRVSIIGGGLAGCEAAYQLAKRGLAVDLFEMRFSGEEVHSGSTTPAHQTGMLAELVCSNSLKSTEPANAHGLLKLELESLDSLVLRCARRTSLPAGKALAVDRIEFARAVTSEISSLKNIRIISREVLEVPGGTVIVASGPLTTGPLAASISKMLGQGSLFFYDAIAPVVSAESLDHGLMFKASRYSDEPGEYWNCPLSKSQYLEFVSSLVSAGRHF